MRQAGAQGCRVRKEGFNVKYVCCICGKELNELDLIPNDEGRDICPYCGKDDLEQIALS
jgi:DNA-directed RNA polymerase subunit RPC12/RpoP